MEGSVSPLTDKVRDALRVAVLVIGLAALGWVLLSRYGGSARTEPYRRQVRDFFTAALARDSVRLRTMATSEEPVVWALAASAKVPSQVPERGAAMGVQGVQRYGDTTEVLVWVVGGCQSFLVTFVGQGRARRIASVRTECVSRGADSLLSK